MITDSLIADLRDQLKTTANCLPQLLKEMKNYSGFVFFTQRRNGAKIFAPLRRFLTSWRRGAVARNNCKLCVFAPTGRPLRETKFA
jgi:hypothetical protein